MQIDPYLSPCTKFKYEWIKDLTIKPNTLNLVEEVLCIYTVVWLRPLVELLSVKAGAIFSYSFTGLWDPTSQTESPCAALTFVDTHWSSALS